MPQGTHSRVPTCAKLGSKRQGQNLAVKQFGVVRKCEAPRKPQKPHETKKTTTISSGCWHTVHAWARFCLLEYWRLKSNSINCDNFAKTKHRCKQALPKPYPSHTRTIPEPHPNHTRATPEPCPNHTRTAPSHIRTTPEPHPNHTRTMSGQHYTHLKLSRRRVMGLDISFLKNHYNFQAPWV